jgi:hypothetical protein
MAYTKVHADWKDDPDHTTPILADDMEHIEAGIAAAATVADAAEVAGVAIPKTLIDAKGDLIVGSAADTSIRKAVGADDTVLVAAAAQSGGVTWTQIGNAQVATAAAIARSKLAVETRHLPCQMTAPSDANSYPTVTFLSNWYAYLWTFIKDVDGFVSWQVRVPDSLAATPNAKIVYEIIANATSGVTRLISYSKNAADGAAMNAALTAETAQDITVPGTAYLRKKVTFTLTNAPAAGDILYGAFGHAGAHANDTLAVDTLLLGAWLSVDVS